MSMFVRNVAEIQPSPTTAVAIVIATSVQTQARRRWIDARKQELLQTRYFHVVFTLPHELHTLVLQNQAVLYNLLFLTVAETLREVARNPKHLGARSVSSASFTLGDRTCSFILTFTA